MIQRFAGIVCALVLAVVIAAPIQSVQAQSTSSNDAAQRIASDPILSGLWSGVNLSFGSGSNGYMGSSSSPSGTPRLPTKDAYVALGDSVAAGVGLATPSQVPTAEVRCGRTTEAYPNAVARAVNLPLIYKACSGATTRDFYTRDWYPSPSLPAQLNSAFSGGTPKLITITSGANDLNWEYYLRLCASSGNCARVSNTSINSLLRNTQNRIDTVLRQISTRSGNAPPVVVITGYYNPVSASCSTTYPQATPEEIAWLGARIADLNRSLQQSAERTSFARFAPVDFTGRDICSANPWVQGINDPRPIHPTTEGQQAIAQAVLRSLDR